MNKLRPKPPHGSLLALNCAVALFGMAGPIGKAVAVPPVTVVFCRAAIAAGVLWLWVLAGKSKCGELNTTSSRETPAALFPHRYMTVLVAASGALLAVHWTAFFRSVQVSGVAVGLLSFATFPVFMALLEPVFLKGRLRDVDLFKPLFVAVGLALVVPKYDFRDEVVQGAACGVFAALTFALLAFANRWLLNWFPAGLIAAWQNTVTALILGPLIVVSIPRISARDGIRLLTLGVFCTALAHALYIRGLRFVRPGVVGILSALEPVYGIVVAIVFMGETLRVRCLLGGLIIVVVAVWAAAQQRANGSWREGVVRANR